MPWAAIVTGIALPAAVLFVAVRQRTLTVSAAIATGLVTAGVAFLAGWEWALGIDAYLVGPVVWVPFRRHAKSKALDRPLGAALLSPADALAPLAWPVIVALGDAYLGHTPQAFAIFAGALAAASADLWATEVGVLSGLPPRDLVRKTPVPAGTAGAVSILGIVAATVGAWGIGLAAMASHAVPRFLADQPMDVRWGFLPLVCTLAGLVGTMVDSILGSIAQGMYYCSRCERPTDRPWHHCGSPTQKERGWRGLTNPRVDLIAGMVGGAVALVLWLWLA